MVASEIMTKQVVTVNPQKSVKEVAKLLVDHRFSAVPVVDRQGKLVGIVSEADIMTRKGKQARSIMSTEIVSASEETPIEEIADLLMTHRIKRVPILRRGKIVGIVSRADIVRAIALGKHVALHSPIYDL